MTTRIFWLLVLCATLVAAVALVFSGTHLAAPVQESINVDDVLTGFDLDSLSTAHKLALAGGLVLALLAATEIVPIALLMVLSVFRLIALTPLMSPLILASGLLWRALAA